MRDKPLWRRLVPIVSAFLLVSCASTYTRLARMSPSELRTVSDSDLCEAYAQSGDPNLGSINRAMFGAGNGQQVMDEVQRRHISCESEMRYYRVDCSGLAILSAQAVSANAYMATVQNRTADSKSFIIVSGSIASEGFILGPGESRSYLITATQQVAAVAGVLNPASSGISLSNCRSVKYR